MKPQLSGFYQIPEIFIPYWLWLTFIKLLLPIFSYSVIAQDKQWDKTLGGNHYDNLTSLQRTFDGGYIVGGYSNSGSSGDKSENFKEAPDEQGFVSTDYWVVKLDAGGKKVWDKTFGGNRQDELTTLVTTPDGGYLLGGNSYSGISGDKSDTNRSHLNDYWIVKINANGQKEWDKTFGGNDQDWLSVVIATADGGYLLGGDSGSDISGDKTQESHGFSDYWIVKINADGQKIWDKTFGGNEYDNLSTMVATPEGGFLLGGSSRSRVGGDKSDPTRGEEIGQEGDSDYWVIKTDSNGNKLWDKTFGGYSYESLTALALASGGGYLLGGTSASGANADKSQAKWGLEDYWIIKIDNNGAKVWDKRFGSTGNDQLQSLVATPDEGFLLGGTSWSGIGGNKSEERRGFWLVKIDKDGNSRWDKAYGSISSAEGLPGEELRDMIVTPEGFLLGGTSTSGKSGDKTEASRDQCKDEEWWCSPGDYWAVKINDTGKKNQILTFNPILTKTLGDPPFALSAHSTSRLAVSFKVLSGPATVKDSIVTLTGTGTVIIEASQVGNDSFFAAAAVTQTFLVEENLPIHKQWDKTYGGTLPPEDYLIGRVGHSELTKMMATPDGGYLFAGYSNSYPGNDKSKKPIGESDYWLVRTNATGKKVWDKIYGAYDNDVLTDVIATPDEGFLLGGLPNGKDNRFILVKTDGSGNKIWGKEIPYIGCNLKLAAANNGYLLASTWPNDYRVIKVDESGNEVWKKSFGGAGADTLTAVLATPDGGFLLGGYSNSGISGDKSQASRGNSDFWVIKVNGNGTKVWDKTYGGNKRDLLSSILVTPDGGYLLGGSSASGSSGDKSQANRGNYDYWLIKINASGTKIWDKTYGGNNNDELTALSTTLKGDFWLGGNSVSAISGDKSQASRDSSDYWIVKIDAMGNKLLDKVYGGSAPDKLKDIISTHDGGNLVGGTSASGISGDKNSKVKGAKDFWVIKLDGKPENTTKKEQTITFNGSSNLLYNPKPFTLFAKASSGLPVIFKIVSGKATISDKVLTTTGVGVVTVKASQAGNATYHPATDVYRSFIVEETAVSKIWDKTLGGNFDDVLTAIISTPDGGYLLGGMSESGKSGNKSEVNRGAWYDYWVVKVDATGKKVWDKTFGGNGDDRLSALVATADGGYLLGGNSGSEISGDKSEEGKGAYDYWVVKINENGKKLWDKTLGGTGNDECQALVVTPDGGYLLGGVSGSGISGEKSESNRGEPYTEDYWVIKIDANGKKVWDKTIGGSADENFRALVNTPDGGYLLGGSSPSGISDDKRESSKGDYDYWVVKLDAGGKKVWEKTLGGNKSDELQALVATPDGGYLLGGYSLSDKSGDRSEANRFDCTNEDWNCTTDYWVVKIDGNGKKVWDKAFGGKRMETLTALLATPDKGYLLGGFSYSGKDEDKSHANRSKEDIHENSITSDFWVVKIDGHGDKVWDKTIGGNHEDRLQALIPTNDGNYLLGGISKSDISGDKSEFSREFYDYWIVKIQGETLRPALHWNMRYGGMGSDNFTDAIKTNDGGYLAGGYSASASSGDKGQSSQGKNDYWIVKSDKSGKKLWDKRFGGSEDDYLNRVIQTQDGGYLLGGSSLSGSNGDKSKASQGNRDYWIVKTDKQGNKQWDKIFGGSGSDELKKVIQLRTGEYVLGGHSNSPVSDDKTQASQGGSDYWIIKISNSGEKLWDKRYGGTKEELLGSFTTTREGGLLLGGSSYSDKSGDKSQASRGGSDYWVVKTDQDGNLVWEKSYGGSGPDEVYSVGRSQGDKLFISGTSSSGKAGDKSQESQGGEDYWLVKLDAQGAKLWDRTFGGSKDDELRASTYTDAGHYVLAGHSYSEASGDKSQTSQGSSDYWVVAVDADGDKVMDQRFGGSGKEELRTVFQTNDGGLLLGGRSVSGVSGDKSQPSQGGTDYWLVKVAPLTSAMIVTRVATVIEEPETELNTLQAYPNPFTDQLSIRFTLPETQFATVKVYDLQGREVATLFNAEVKANQTYEVEWQTGNKPIGLYYLQLQTPIKRHQYKLLLNR